MYRCHAEIQQVQTKGDEGDKGVLRQHERHGDHGQQGQGQVGVDIGAFFLGAHGGGHRRHSIDPKAGDGIAAPQFGPGTPSGHHLFQSHHFGFGQLGDGVKVKAGQADQIFHLTIAGLFGLFHGGFRIDDHLDQSAPVGQFAILLNFKDTLARLLRQPFRIVHQDIAIFGGARTCNVGHRHAQNRDGPVKHIRPQLVHKTAIGIRVVDDGAIIADLPFHGIQIHIAQEDGGGVLAEGDRLFGKMFAGGQDDQIPNGFRFFTAQRADIDGFGFVVTDRRAFEGIAPEPGLFGPGGCRPDSEAGGCRVGGQTKFGRDKIGLDVGTDLGGLLRAERHGKGSAGAQRRRPVHIMQIQGLAQIHTRSNVGRPLGNHLHFIRTGHAVFGQIECQRDFINGQGNICLYGHLDPARCISSAEQIKRFVLDPADKGNMGGDVTELHIPRAGRAVEDQFLRARHDALVQSGVDQHAAAAFFFGAGRSGRPIVHFVIGLPAFLDQGRIERIFGVIKGGKEIAHVFALGQRDVGFGLGQICADDKQIARHIAVAARPERIGMDGHAVFKGRLPVNGHHGQDRRARPLAQNAQTLHRSAQIAFARQVCAPNEQTIAGGAGGKGQIDHSTGGKITQITFIGGGDLSRRCGGAKIIARNKSFAQHFGHGPDQAQLHRHSACRDVGGVFHPKAESCGFVRHGLFGKTGRRNADHRRTLIVRGLVFIVRHARRRMTQFTVALYGPANGGGAEIIIDICGDRVVAFARVLFSNDICQRPAEGVAADGRHNDRTVVVICGVDACAIGIADNLLREIVRRRLEAKLTSRRMGVIAPIDPIFGQDKRNGGV